MTILVDELVPFGSSAWALFAGLALAGRAADLLSTWIATPNLALEGNPVARHLGWRWGVPLNVAAALAAGSQPLLSVAMTTTSCLVAARNFQQAWVMRSLGEWRYRLWMSERLAESPRGLAVACHLAEAALVAAPGVALLLLGGDRLAPFGVGLGMVAYAGAVALFTMLGLLRR
jgi:hypothetical protein